MKYLILVLAGLLFLSCEKDKDNEPEIITSDGTLLWLGEPAVDGCGLILEVDSDFYFTSSRRDEFINFEEEDSGSIDVTARYRIAGEEKIISWGCTAIPIVVLDIKRR